ncbi:MAG: biopolymer transporter ExbD [Alphaproteobacteria bacterium]|nr:biopolymer transporter ExbD [Alphaproteobacteria bacterium]
MQSRRRIASFPAAAEMPISTLNTTPLIDVMLVLLIMFIVTIPIATHKVRVDLPNGAAVVTKPEIHELALDQAGRLSWDGAPLAQSALPDRLGAMHRDHPDALLRLRSDGLARYEDFDRLLAAVKRSGVDRLAFVGNEGFAAAIG